MFKQNFFLRRGVIEEKGEAFFSPSHLRHRFFPPPPDVKFWLQFHLAIFWRDFWDGRVFLSFEQFFSTFALRDVNQNCYSECKRIVNYSVLLMVGETIQVFVDHSFNNNKVSKFYYISTYRLIDSTQHTQQMHRLTVDKHTFTLMKLIFIHFYF